MSVTKSVKVLVATPIGSENVRGIAGVSPQVSVVDASDAARSDYRGEPGSKEKLDALLADAEIVYGRLLPKNLISRAPGLKWVQTMAAGADHYLKDKALVESPVILTGIAGMHAVQISEFVIGRMLMFAKQAPLSFRLHQEKQWKPFYSIQLASKTIGIVGLGSIGREVARLAKAFRMNVTAIRRTAKSAGTARYVDKLLPPEQLKTLLSESDFVVLTLPLTPETKGMIGEKELRLLKPTAYLVNVSRGEVINEDALIRALKENWFAGAALDTFTIEPLPADSPLWTLPNVIFSPHSAGGVEDYNARSTEIFCANLKRYLDGKRLHNVVDKKVGY